MKITGSEKTNNKMLFVILSAVIIICLLASIPLLLNKYRDTEEVNNNITPTPNQIANNTDLNINNDNSTTTNTNNVTITPGVTPWNQNTLIKDIVELPISDAPLNENIKWPIDNIEEYIDKSKILQQNWDSIFIQNNLKVGDFDSLRNINEEKFKLLSEKYGIELNGSILEEFLINKLNEIHINIKNQILNYPDSLETDILLRLIEFHKPGHDEINNTLFGSTAPKGLNVREWFSIAAYWIFNNDFNYNEENQKSYDYIYTSIMNSNLFLEESKDIKFITIFDRGPENLEADSMKISLNVRTIFNGEFRSAVLSVKDGELILIDY